MHLFSSRGQRVFQIKVTPFLPVNEAFPILQNVFLGLARETEQAHKQSLTDQNAITLIIQSLFIFKATNTGS